MSDYRCHGLISCLLAAALTSAANANEALDGVRLEICYQHSCARQVEVQLSSADVKHLLEAFGARAEDASAERRAIARAIAAFEQLIGPITGTDRDLGGTFPGAFRAGQMDCIDEATNTTRYLQLLEQAGLLRWHRVAEPATRLPIPRRWWPHTTAVIREHATGEQFAVDSWFEPNGYPPHIVDLTTWRRGWKPAAESTPE
jgi:hypothetical protein